MKIIDFKDFDFKPRVQVYDHDTLEKVRLILDDIKIGGAEEVRRYAVKFGDIAEAQSLFVMPDELKAAYEALPNAERDVLTRTAARIKAFAEAQRASVSDLKFPIAGGFAGHKVMPMEVAACYAPGGRYPLPSSVLMTVIPARAAGVKVVYLASPKPTIHTLAAAYIAGVDGMLRIGGAQAIGAFAYGMEGVLPADVIVGPGNRYVTAAKQIVSGHCAIDMLAGPSELAVLADEQADASVIASDLLAQAEHDVDARPILISPSRSLIDNVLAEIEAQLKTLPTASIAEVSVGRGLAVHTQNMDEALQVLNHMAAEHVEVMSVDARALAARVLQAGGLFIGANAAEVIGDYGAGPNHTLPTGGTARFKAGLSVFNFIRMTTWIDIEDADKARALYEDAAALGRIEGLEAHARSAEKRLK